MKPWLNIVMVWALGGAILLGAGCVTYEQERVTPLRDTRLTVARVGERVTLQFPSEKGLSYTILYSTNLNSGVWLELPSATRIAGTGKVISIEDTVAEGSQRYYRLQVLPDTRGSARSRRKK